MTTVYYTKQRLSRKTDFCAYIGKTLSTINLAFHKHFFLSNCEWPASVAQLDARPTGDQVVAGSTPAEVGNILSWRLIMKYFLRSFSPFRWFKKKKIITTFLIVQSTIFLYIKPLYNSHSLKQLLFSKAILLKHDNQSFIWHIFITRKGE